MTIRRGGIWRTTLAPTAGSEIWGGGPAPVLVISPDAINALGMPLVAPISRGGKFDRERGFTVPLIGANIQTEGVVLCRQIRIIDLQARSATFIEDVDNDIIGAVLDKCRALFEL